MHSNYNLEEVRGQRALGQGVLALRELSIWNWVTGGRRVILDYLDHDVPQSFYTHFYKNTHA